MTSPDNSPHTELPEQRAQTHTHPDRTTSRTVLNFDLDSLHQRIPDSWTTNLTDDSHSIGTDTYPRLLVVYPTTSDISFRIDVLQPQSQPDPSYALAVTPFDPKLSNGTLNDQNQSLNRTQLFTRIQDLTQRYIPQQGSERPTQAPRYPQGQVGHGATSSDSGNHSPPPQIQYDSRTGSQHNTPPETTPNSNTPSRSTRTQHQSPYYSR